MKPCAGKRPYVMSRIKYGGLLVSLFSGRYYNDEQRDALMIAARALYVSYSERLNRST